MQLHSTGSGRFEVSVLSPAGDGNETFSDSSLPQEWSKESPGYVLRDLASSGSKTLSKVAPEEMGARLFKALFPGSIQRLFERSLDLAKTEDAGLRIKILLNPHTATLRFFQGYPWELLHQGHFFALSRRTPVVRCLPVPLPPTSPKFPERVRVLAALAAPREASALNLQQELAGMKESELFGRFEIAQCQGSLTPLRRKLVEHEPFHVLHYLGHGSFLSNSAEGVLIFEGSDGCVETVDGKTLAQKLHDRESLQLIVLNACKTGQAPLTSIGNPFGGVAGALVREGFPAVIAMQEAVPDKAAVLLSQTLYRQLPLGQPIEAALAEARHAVYDLDTRGFMWATPSLFLRSVPSEREQDDTESKVKAALDLFRSRQHAPARRVLQEILAVYPGHETARFYETLTRMALGNLSLNAIAEIDDILQGFIATKEASTARLALLALGILRVDAARPRALHSRGISSSKLYQRLERVLWTREDKLFAESLEASRNAMILFNLAN